MCFGGSFMKKILPVLAIGAAIYLGGSSLFGAGAGGAAGASQGATGLLGGNSLFGSLAGSGAGGAAAGAASAAAGAGASGLGNLFSGAMSFLKSPSFLLGQGLNAAGVLSNSIGYSDQQDEFSKANKENAARNALLTGEANKINEESLGNFTLDRQNSQLNEAINSRLAANEAIQAPAESVYLPSAGSAPKDVKSTLAKVINDKLVQGRRTQAAGTKLNAESDLSLGNALSLDESARKLNQLGNFTEGNNTTLGNSLTAIKNKQRTSLSLGDALQGAGSIVNAYSVNKPKSKAKPVSSWLDGGLAYNLPS